MSDIPTGLSRLELYIDALMNGRGNYWTPSFCFKPS